MKTSDRMKPERKLTWKPVLRGKIYCSSACGGGCTKAAYNDCVKKAKALAKRMGKGWRIRVWENLGWHYHVRTGKPQGPFLHGFIEISPPSCKGDEYTAWIQTNPQFIVSHKNPKAALSLAIRAMDKHIASLVKTRKLIDETQKEK